MSLVGKPPWEARQLFLLVPVSAGPIQRAISPESGVRAVTFGDDLLADDRQTGLLDPGPVGRGIGMAPPHRRIATQPVVLTPGPGALPGGGQEPPSWSEPAADPVEQRRLLIQRHVDERVQADDGIEG